MKQSTSRFVQKALRHVYETYGFLFERGYEVFSAEEINLGWQVVLRKGNLFLIINNVREEEELYFRTDTPRPDGLTDIGSVIYAATGDKIPRWESSDLKVLERYLDRIELYFASEYVKNKDGLQAAQQEYFAAFSQGGVVVQEAVVPAEPKPIPVHHYPLIGLILLLLFGALTTLYMVLLDRLFSAFSLPPDLYRIFMGLALLLAIGTMLLFWMQRKKS